MDIKELQLFLHLSKSLHYAKTSQDCHVSPSTLTRVVQKLEQQSGCLLLERDNRTVRLTREGVMFREFAVAVMDNWQQFQAEVSTSVSSLHGELSVFCSVTASYSFLHELLDRYRADYPEVEIHLHTGDSAMAVQRIQEELEDISVAARPDKLPGNLEFKEIGQSKLVFIAPLASSEARKKWGFKSLADISDWQGIPFIASESGLARQRTDRWFRAKGVKPSIYAQVSGNEAIVSMVSLGFGIGVVPLLVVQNSLLGSKIEILDVSPPLEPFSIGLCTMKRKLGNPLVQAFWNLA
ncbi:MAG: HTH-type transcriptional activator IlvY [Pseudomonadales bacterium]|nr:HTH-type transcriptional activator IlvY [Pseudomonadales bacterium]